MKTNATLEQLDKALKNVNKKFNNNVIFNRYPERNSKLLNFTLKVKNSSGEGARSGFTGRKLISACWHVHGEFFDSLFAQDENIFIWARGKKITVFEGNWEDNNIGSMVNPLCFSDACKCNYY